MAINGTGLMAKQTSSSVHVGKCAVRDADGGYDLSCGGGRCKWCMSSQLDDFRNYASFDMLLTLHRDISSVTDGVFSAEEMLLLAVVVNGRPRCPLPPRPSKSTSMEKQYYCEDVASWQFIIAQILHHQRLSLFQKD